MGTRPTEGRRTASVRHRKASVPTPATNRKAAVPTAALLAFVAAILRLRYARRHGRAEQQHTSRSGNQSSVHRYSPLRCGRAPCTARCTFPAPNAGRERVFRCETEEHSVGR